MREIVHIQAGQCGNQIGAKVSRYIQMCVYIRNNLICILKIKILLTLVNELVFQKATK